MEYNLNIVVAKHLYHMADLIETRGLAQGTTEDLKGGLCIQGAAHMTLTGSATLYFVSPEQRQQVSEPLVKLRHAVGDQLNLTDVTGWGRICTWNNEDHRTADEVVAMLRQAAARVGNVSMVACVQ